MNQLPSAELQNYISLLPQATSQGHWAHQQFTQQGWPGLQHEGWRQFPLKKILFPSHPPRVEQLSTQGFKPSADYIERARAHALGDGMALSGFSVFPETFKSVDTNQELTHTWETSGAFGIRVEAGVTLRLRERFPGSNPWFQRSLFLDLAPGASVEHYFPSEEFHGQLMTHTYAQVSAQSSYQAFMLDQGNEFRRHQLFIDLLEEKANCSLRALVLGKETECAQILSTLTHHAPHTKSEQEVRVMAAGLSRCFYQGKIIMKPHVSGAKASQLGRNLLLSPKAQALGQPQLEIFWDDVECTHGFTTGEISPEELFYLESRAIPSARAREILINSFGQEILGYLPKHSFSKEFQKNLDQAIPLLISQTSENS